MQKEEPFLIVPRAFFSCDVWRKDKFSKLESFLWLINQSRWQNRPSKVNNIICKRGQVVVTYSELMLSWNLSDRKEAKRYLDWMTKKGLVSYKTDINGTLVSITHLTSECHKIATPSATQNATPNNNDNQDVTDDIATPSATQNATNVPQLGKSSRAQVITESDLFNNLENIDVINKVEVESPYNPPREKPKGYENFDFSFVDDKFYDVFTQWLDYKRSGGNKRFIYKSQKSLETCYNGIVKTSKGNPDAAIEILIHCITSSYQGFFAPRDFWESYSKTFNIDYPQDFEDDFSLYGRKGSKVDGYNRWKNLTEEDKVKMRRHIPYYLQSNDRQFLKDFDGYINQRLFESPVYHKSNLLFDPQTIENNEAGVYDPSGWLNYDESFNAWRYFGREPKYDLRDGYTDENRPDGARVVTQATVYLWSAANKNWSLTK